MKKLLFTSLLALGLLLPTTYSASTNDTASTKELSNKKPRKSGTSRTSTRTKKQKLINPKDHRQDPIPRAVKLYL